MKLFFLSPLTNTSRALTVDPNDTIHSLKAQISNLEDIEISQQFLSYGCKPLKDSQTIISYGLHDNSTINLSLRLLGGSTEPRVYPKGLYKDPSLGKLYDVQVDDEAGDVRFSVRNAPEALQGIEALQNAFKEKSEARLLNAENANVFPLGTHKDSVNSAKINPAGTHILSVGNDNMAKVFDFQTRQEVASYGIDSFEDEIKGAVYSEDQKYVIIATETGVLRFVDFEGKELHTISGVYDGHVRIKSIAISNGYKYLALGLNEGTVKVYDLATRQLKFQCPKLADCIVSALDISLDNKILAVGLNNGEIRLFDLQADGLEIYYFDNAVKGGINAMKISQDSQYIVAGGWDKSLIVLDVGTKEVVQVWENAHQQQISAVAISQGNKYIISGGYDKVVKVFDLETKHLLHEFKKAHNAPISDISVSKNNEFLVTCSWDKSVKLLQLEIQHRLEYFPDAHKNIVTSVAISPDNKYAVSGSWDKSIAIFDLESKKEIHRIENAHQSQVSCLTITKDSKYIISGSQDLSIKFFSLKNFEEAFCIGEAHKKNVSCLVVTNDNKFFISASWDQSIKIFDLESRREMFRFEEAHPSLITSLTISNDNKYLVSTSRRHVKVFDLKNRREVLNLTNIHSADVTHACLTNDNKSLITCSDDKSIKIFDFNTNQLIHNYSNIHENQIKAFAISKDDKYLITTSVDKSIKIFDLQTKLQLYQLKNATKAPISAISFSEDSKYIAISTYQNEVAVFNFPYYDRSWVFPRSLKIPVFLLLGNYENFILNINNDEERLRNIEMYRDLYFIPYNWTVLHLLAIFEPHNMVQIPAYADFKTSFVVDNQDCTPLHYLIAHKNLEFPSINATFKYILDFLEDSEQITTYEYNRTMASLSNIFPFIISKISPTLVTRYLQLTYTQPAVSWGYEPPRFGAEDTKKYIAETPVLNPIIERELYDAGQERVSFGLLNLNFDYHPLSNDMLKVIMTLSECSNEEYFRSKTISNLVNHLWGTSRLFHSIIGAFYSALMIITSIYIGLDVKRTGLEVAILVMSAGFLGLEALQIYVLRSKYLSSVWNYMDILFFVLTITTMALMLGGLSDDLARSWLFSMVLMLGYVRWMAYLRLFDAPRTLIRATLTILEDMWGFLTIILLIVVGFSLIFLEFDRSVEYKDHLYETYNRLYGNYDDSEYSTSQRIINAIILFFLSVVLLNMLIALMGDSYGKVQETRVLTDSQTRLDMILESTILMRLFEKRDNNVKKQYLMYCEPKGEEDEVGGESNQWEGGINVLKKLLRQSDQKMSAMSSDMKELEQRFNMKVAGIEKKMEANYTDIMNAIKSLKEKKNN